MARPNTTWANPLAQELLQDCLAERLTAGETAKILSRRLGRQVSRNAVMGRAWRDRMSFNGSKADDELKRQRKIRKRQERAERMRIKRALEYAARDAVKQREVDAIGPEPKPCGDGERGCRFPAWGFDDRPSHIYCGAPRSPLLSYCGYHQKVAYQRVSEGQAKKIIEAAAA